MKYMTLVHSTEGSGMPPASLMEAIARLGAEATKAGVLVQTGGLMPTAVGARLRLKDGEIALRDGPFAEAKEVVGGFAVYDVATKADALIWCERFLDLHRRHWPGWEGEVELRQMMDMPG